MKKVGIVTYQYNNYGTKLQNYALKRALEGIDCNVRSIAIRNRKDTYVILAKLIIKSSIRFAALKYRKFSSFSRDNLGIRRVLYANLNKAGLDFDYLVAGSDQVWNPMHLETRPKDMRLFFLQFVEKHKRVAYAPSFGVDSLTSKQQATYKDAIRGFSALSVREPSGAKIIDDLTSNKATVAPDPTFLLDKKEWDSLTSEHDSTYVGRSYIAVYYLSKQPDSVYQDVKLYADKNNLEIIIISGDVYSEGAIIPDPAEFVSIIKNARVVFTDSFHACVFSIITRVPFIVRHRTDVSQFTRIDNLLKSFDLSEAEDKGKLAIQERIDLVDLVGTELILSEYKKQGMAFLRKAIS